MLGKDAQQLWAFTFCMHDLEDRFGEDIRLVDDAHSKHLVDSGDGRYVFRSVVAVLDDEGELELRSRFRCAVESSDGEEMFFSRAKVDLSVDSADHPRRHALWPWPWRVAVPADDEPP